MKRLRKLIERMFSSEPRAHVPTVPVDASTPPTDRKSLDPDIVLDEPLTRRPTVRLQVLRFSSQEESTLGVLMDVTDPDRRKFLCFTLEDEFRTQKKYGETRIPAGVYEVLLRTEGGFHQRYMAKFPEIHRGMLWLQDVPGFEYILIHIGNKDDDTAGCLLVGDTSIQNVTDEGMIGSSTSAYKRIYPPIAEAIANGERVQIEYIDYDYAKDA
jgi:hypothetical protein